MLDTELCLCGSGLRWVRCCGMDMAALPDQPALATLDAAGAEATKLFNEKKTAEAEALSLKLLDLAPNHRLPLRVLFEIRKAGNNPKAAEVLARRLASIPAANAGIIASANLQLAQLLIGQGRYADAEPAARKAVIANPRDVTIQHVMGVVLTETGKLLAGERHYRQAAILLGRDDGMVLANIAWNLKLQNRLDEAAALYQTALALKPDNSRGVGGFAQVQMARGQTGAAVNLLDAGLARWPNDRTLRLLRAMTDLSMDRPQAVLDRLNDPAGNLLPAELTARGQALALLNLPVEAVTAFAQAKKQQRERYGQSYAPAPYIKKAVAYKAYFTADRLLAIPRASHKTGPQPVFLLGFPRSGLSLLENMLGQTPGFVLHGGFTSIAGLADLLPRLAGAETNYPEALDDLLAGDAWDVPDRLRSRYLAGRYLAGRYLAGRYLAGFENAAFIIDRQQDNFWHLGLIKLLFPNALIVHLLRHPLDIALSNLAQDKKLEANCNVSMAALARHYDLTMSMIRHYRGQLTLRYLPVRYEDLAASPAETLAQIADYTGNMAASSYTGFHQRGLYRHRAYLAAMPHLFDEILPILQPWIDELGYGDIP